MNEWEFTGDAASWINECIQRNPSLPFSRAKTEQRGQGSLKRRDLTLLDKNKVPVLTGEIKLPYAKDGSTPYNDAVVRDARLKAFRAKTHFFFTWNVNEFVLWETALGKESFEDQKYRSWQVTAVHKETHLDTAQTLQSIQSWLDKFLIEFADILRGISPIGFKPPDERFIDLLESALHTPIMMTFEALQSRYSDPKFKRDLDCWMREEGWTILDDLEGINDNLENASKYACYALVNKLVFYEALLKRYADKMERISVQEHIDTGEQLRLHLEGYFAKAKEVTGDYLTVFGEDHMAIENRIPFYSDAATLHWWELISQIHKFDFSKIDYEVIGSIFERLISPEERHKYGKYYTRVEVVDLINSFCIRTGRETIMDPACGGGTFLVRAYARKKELSPVRTHVQLLSDLFGIDVSRIPTHLTTINLATRDLIDQDNYPQVARNDFFDVANGKTFISLPKRVESRTLGKRREVIIPALDAVVSNPPYVKQEDIPKSKKGAKGGPKSGTKEYYQKLVKDEAGVKFSGRSDLHCYFWPHSASFLKPDGYLCLLTSSQWLDVEYGFRLQDWILGNFRIIAVFESMDEPWFVGARVATAITCLQREPDETKRMENIIRFVQLRRPIAELLAHDGSSIDAVITVDRFRDEVLALTENTVNERYRARLVKQQQLWTDGVRLGALVHQANPGDVDDSDDVQLGPGDYYGAKWGIYLRTPDLWFKVIDNYGNNLVPIVNLANIARGIRTGRDWFFYVKDVSDQCLADTNTEHFKPRYGVSRQEVESRQVRLVLTGKKSEKIMPLEARYLKPLVRSIIELDTYAVTETDCDSYVVQIGDERSMLEDTYALKYILWAEGVEKRKGLPKIPSQRPEKEWFDLTGFQPGKILCPIAHQYKHVMPTNDHNLLNNQRFITINPKSGTDASTLAGILNSTIALFSKYRYGRPVGVEGNLDTTVIDVKMMLVPDPAKGTASSRQRVSRAFENLKRRKALMFLSDRRLRKMAYDPSQERELNTLSNETELDMPDRQELDDAVLEVMGIDSPECRQQLIDELYAHLREFFEATRQKEEKGIINKYAAKRRDRVHPADIAAQIHKDISENEPELLRRYSADFLDADQPFDTYDLPPEGEATAYSDMLVAQAVKFAKGAKRQVALISTVSASQTALIVLVANAGIRGLVRIPHDEANCSHTLESYHEFIEHRNYRFRELIQERTEDEDTQDKTLLALRALLNG